MVNDVITQIKDLISVNINVPLIVILLFIGVFLKHALKKLDNSWIPLILGIVGMVISVLMRIPFNPQTALLTILVEGIIAALFATIIQSKLKDIIAGMKNKVSISSTTDTTKEDTNTDT